MKYRNYEEYLAHQKEKTLDPMRRRKWLGEEWQLKLKGFREIFEGHKAIVNRSERALCVGARTGQEVQALHDMNIKAIGIDLVPHPPLVLQGDMHDISFPDCSFDFAFSNAFDYSLYPEHFISEIERVLRPAGHALMQFRLGPDHDNYAETIIYRNSDVVGLFKQSDAVIDRCIPENFAAMDSEIVMRKTGQGP